MDYSPWKLSLFNQTRVYLPGSLSEFDSEWCQWTHWSPLDHSWRKTRCEKMVQTCQKSWTIAHGKCHFPLKPVYTSPGLCQNSILSGVNGLTGHPWTIAEGKLQCEKMVQTCQFSWTIAHGFCHYSLKRVYLPVDYSPLFLSLFTQARVYLPGSLSEFDSEWCQWTHWSPLDYSWRKTKCEKMVQTCQKSWTIAHGYCHFSLKPVYTFPGLCQNSILSGVNGLTGHPWTIAEGKEGVKKCSKPVNFHGL